jgi:hypothetical protein
MLMLLFAPSALVAQAPAAPPQAFDQLQELLEAIPEALIAGRRGAMRGLVAKAKAGWDRSKPELRKAMPEPELIAIDRQLKAMRTMKPNEQAVGALGISGTLSRFQPRSHQQDLLQADRTTMLAWCTVDAGQLERLPGVAAAFQPLIDQDKGRHALAIVGVQETLKRLQDSQQKRQPAKAKKALKELLAFVDVLEKP